MNKRDLIVAVAEDNPSLKKGAVQAVVDGVFARIAGALRAGEQVRINDLGTFSVKGRDARTFRNPKTGEAVEKPASKTVRFKAGEALKQAVNG